MNWSISKVVAVMLLGTSSSAMAQTFNPSWDAYDTADLGGNGDKCISQAEADRWAADMSAVAASDAQKAAIRGQMSKLATQTCVAIKPKKEFKAPSKFSLQGSRPRIAFDAAIDPETNEKTWTKFASGNMAEFSLKNDREAGTEVGSVKLGLAYALNDPDWETIERGGFRLSSHSLWTDFSGKFDSSQGNKTKVRLGYQAYWIRSGGLFNAQTFSLAPFYMTDMHGNARGYGIEGSWEPVHHDGPINLDPRSGLGVSAHLLGRKVDKGGETGLSDGLEQVIGTLSISAKRDLPFKLSDAPITLSATYDYSHEFISGDDEELVTIGLGVPITPSGNAIFSVDHKIGHDVSTRQAKDETTASFKFRY